MDQRPLFTRIFSCFLDHAPKGRCSLLEIMSAEAYLKDCRASYHFNRNPPYMFSPSEPFISGASSRSPLLLLDCSKFLKESGFVSQSGRGDRLDLCFRQVLHCPKSNCPRVQADSESLPVRRTVENNLTLDK